MKENLKPYVYKLWNTDARKGTVNRVLFVERSGELRRLARLSAEGAEPKGNQVLTERPVSRSRPETG